MSGHSVTLNTAEQAAENRYLTIGALAKLCNVTVRTLRYYEEMDLIGPVKRTDGKYRLYTSCSLKRVQAILALQNLNFSLEEILSILGPFSQSRKFTRSEQIEHTRQSLSQQKEYVEDKLRQLLDLKTEIEERLQTLDAVCEPCMTHEPQVQCPESCKYLEVHN